jgi:distribution and morphology protein 31
VPKWKDSRLSFKHVYVSRRPSDSKTDQPSSKVHGHLAAVGYDVSNHPAYHRIGDDDEELPHINLQDEDTNYTMFDLNIDSVDVTLSLKRWLDGKGLIEDAVVRGVRGVVGA